MKKVFSLLMVLALVMVGMAQNDAAKPKKGKKVKLPKSPLRPLYTIMVKSIRVTMASVSLCSKTRVRLS